MDHYSKSNFKKSLAHFFVGKLFNGVAGLLYLLIVVRYLEQKEYGIYIGLISLVEIVYMFSGFGVTSFLQRYVPEYRVKCKSTVLRSVVYKIFAFRLLTIIIFILLFAFIGAEALEFFNIVLNEKMIFLFGLYLSGEIIGRALMEVFSALLLQGYQQWILFLKNMIKLAGISYFSFYLDVLDIEGLFIVESIQVYISLVISFVLLANYLSKTTAHKEATDNISKSKRSMISFSLSSYVAQIFSQLYGQSVLNLLVARYLGLSEVAIFGFAQSIVDLVKKYMPSYLLLGMIRPIFISRFAKNRDDKEISRLATLLLKVNIYILACLVVVTYFAGEDLVDFMTNGKYTNITALLITLIILLAFQSFHLIQNIVLATYEKGRLQIIATLISATGILISFVTWEAYGIYGILAGAFVCEVLWAIISVAGLRASGIDFEFYYIGMIKIIVSAIIVFVCYSVFIGIFAQLNIIVESIILTVMFMVTVEIIKGFDSRERSLLFGLVKR